MDILLTNDDSLTAAGIAALHDALTGHGHSFAPLAKQFMTAAPASEQTAASHGITLATPLMAQPVQVNQQMAGIAINGRPADCVKLAVTTLWPREFGENSKPDLVISGMNMGAGAAK